MMKPAICFQLSESVPHADDDFRLNVKGMMRREHSFYRQACNLFKGLQISIGIRGGEPCSQRILIH